MMMMIMSMVMMMMAMMWGAAEGGWKRSMIERESDDYTRWMMICDPIEPDGRMNDTNNEVWWRAYVCVFVCICVCTIWFDVLLSNGTDDDGVSALSLSSSLPPSLTLG